MTSSAVVLAGAIVFMCVAVPFVLPVLLPLLVGFIYIRQTLHHDFARGVFATACLPALGCHNTPERC